MARSAPDRKSRRFHVLEHRQRVHDRKAEKHDVLYYLRHTTASSLVRDLEDPLHQTASKS
jgi:hypothetical protein